MEVHPDSRRYLCFVWKGVRYWYLRMPFGVKNATAVLFQWIAARVGKLPRLLFYVDDPLLYAKSVDEHLEDLCN